MRTTITLPDPVFENARSAAQARGISFSEYVYEALVTALNPRAPAVEPFRLRTFDGELQPGVNIDKISTLLEEEDFERYGRIG